jgi:hypothetical protein
MPDGFPLFSVDICIEIADLVFYANDETENIVADDISRFTDFHHGTDGRAKMIFFQTQSVFRQNRRYHGNPIIRQIDGTAPGPGLFVQCVIFLNILGNIRDMNADEKKLILAFDAQRIIEIKGGLPIYGYGVQGG